MGCGGQSATTATSATPAVDHPAAVTDHTADGVRVLLKRFVRDVRAKRFGAACGLMTSQARAKLASATHLTCARALDGARRAVGDARLARDEQSIDALPVTVAGDRATSQNPEAQGETSHYVYRGGRWRIA
jgi:hypothetical protein